MDCGTLLFNPPPNPLKREVDSFILEPNNPELNPVAIPGAGGKYPPGGPPNAN